MLFEEKLRDKRFYQAERAIFTVYLGEEVSDVDVLARKAGVSKATFYRHHRTLEAVVEDYKELLEVRLEKAFGDMNEAANIEILKFYRRLLFFVLRNRDLFRLIELRGRKSPFCLLEKPIKMSVARRGQLLENEMIYRIYMAEIVAVLEMWAERGVDEGEMEMVLENILYLTKTARIRLGPLKRREEKK